MGIFLAGFSALSGNTVILKKYGLNIQQQHIPELGFSIYAIKPVPISAEIQVARLSRQAVLRAA